MPSYTRLQLENYLSKLDIKAKAVLDIGGSQKPVKGRIKKWEVEEYKIMDLETPHEGQKPDIICDIDSWDAKPFEAMDSFDVVFCLEVFEYILNPMMVARRIYAFLKKGGEAYISFPFIYPHHNPAGKDYLRYTRWGAEAILKQAGFEIVECVPRVAKEPMVLLDFFDVEGMRPSREYYNHNEVGYIYKVKKI